MNKIKKSKFYKICIILFVVVCFCGIVYFVADLIIRNSHISENSYIKSRMDDYIEISVKPQNQSESKVKINFAALKNENADVVGYVKIKNTNIDYVVVQSDDNDYYLHHNFEKKWNTAGWVFADFRNRLDGTDKNIIIYGHNIRDGSMFGSLENVLNKEWYENQDNHEVLFITENGEYKYQVFSVYRIVPEDYYISTDFANDEEFYAFAKTLQERSVYDFGVDVLAENKILTLSSCLGNGEERVVLHAKLVND